MWSVVKQMVVKWHSPVLVYSNFILPTLVQHCSMFVLHLPLHMVHLFKVRSEVIGNDRIVSYFWIERPDVTQQIPITDSGWMGGTFSSLKKLALEPPITVHFVIFWVLLKGGRCPGVPGVPPYTTSTTTGGTRTTGSGTLL